MNYSIRRIPCGNVNCYLIANGTTAVLVDTGRETYRQKVLVACHGLRVCLIALTHGHVDHVQNAAYFSNTLNCPVAIHEADMKLLRDNMEQPLYADGVLGKIVLAASVKSFQADLIAPFMPSISLKDGDSLDSYGIPATVIGLPGHTDGSIGLDIAETNLIVGDALMNMFYPTTSMLYHNKTAMLESAMKIGTLGSRTIYFGHGKPVKNRKWA